MTVALALQLGVSLIIGFGSAALGAWLQRNNTAKIALNDVRRAAYVDYISTAYSIAEYNLERYDNVSPVEAGQSDSMHEALGKVHAPLQLIASKKVLEKVDECTLTLHKEIENGGLLEQVGLVTAVVDTMRDDLMTNKV